MAAIVFQFDGDTCRGLWTDEIDLTELGTVTNTRASNVEWNHETQEWEVRIEGSDHVEFSHRNRATCIEWEREYFNAKFLAN